MVWRTLFFLLVFVNLLVHAWTQGYLGGGGDGREPLRLTQQLHPEKMAILRDARAEVQGPGGVKEAGDDTVCRAVAGLSVAEATMLAGASGLAGWAATVKTTEAAGALHRVLLPELAGKALADRKAGELRQLGVRDFRTIVLGNERYEIVLGSFDTEATAKEALAALNRQGVRSARIDSRGAQVARVTVEIRAPVDALQARLPELVAPHAGASIGECAAP